MQENLKIMAAIIATALVVYLFIKYQNKAVEGTASLRKAAPNLLLVAFLVIFPFTSTFVHWATNKVYGVADNRPATPSIPEPSKATYTLASLGDTASIRRIQVYQTAVDVSGNATTDEIAADQLAGSGVQLNTFFTKLWIAIIFYILCTVLTWRIQQLTHPAPSSWAKDGYSADFKELPPVEKFAVYGRIQLVNVLKIVGSIIAAVLIV